MATPRQAILAALATVRTVLGPSALDIRVTRVIVRTRTWNSGHRGKNTGSAPYYVDSDVELLPRPSVRKVTLREVSASGGKLNLDDVIVDHIQPAVGSGGITQGALAPEPKGDGVEIIYVLSSEDNQGFNGKFSRLYADSGRPFRHTLTLTRRADTPGNL